MNKKISSLILVFIGLVIAILIANAQTAPPVTYTTPARPATAQISDANRKEGKELKGTAAFTVTAANNNDTVTGIFTFALADEARERLARQTSKTTAQIPASVAVKDVAADFERGSACPALHLELRDLEVDFGGTALKLARVRLDVPETQEEMSRLFCTWARQINAKRQRRGVIAAMNRLIAGEP